MRKPFYIIIFLAVVTPAVAQHEATLYFMNSLPQVTYVNPASVPRYKFSVGLPGSSIFTLYGNNGFTYNDFAVKEGGLVRADLNKLYEAMKDKNYINIAEQADIFRFSMKVNPRIYLTYHVSQKTYNSTMIPKEIAGVFINGTIAYVNNTASLAPRAESMTYVESALSSSYKVNKDLTVGVRVKIIKGITNATTKVANVDLSIDDDYAITIRAAGDVRTSGIQALEENSDDLEDFLSNNWEDYLNNSGFGFDLGATYKIQDRLTVGLSLLDIGRIKWTNDLYGYRLDPSRANYTFRGFDLERILDGDDDYIDDEIDSIENSFELEESRVSSYSTPLPAKMYLSGNYQIRRNFNAGLLLFAERFNGRFATGASVALTKDFGRRLTTSLSYTVTNNSFNNIGAGVSLNFAPFQLYIVGDNLLRAPLILAAEQELNSFVNSMHYFNLRAGLNIVFGWDKTEEKQPNSTRLR